MVNVVAVPGYVQVSFFNVLVFNASMINDTVALCLLAVCMYVVATVKRLCLAVKFCIGACNTKCILCGVYDNCRKLRKVKLKWPFWNLCNAARSVTQ